MQKLTFPNGYFSSDDVLVPINAALIPLVGGALRMYEREEAWLTAEDYELGYNAIARLQADMAGASVRDIITAVNQVYRLLDTSLNGTQYEATANPGDPLRPIVTPPIPGAPPGSTDAANAMRAHIGRLWLLAENAATGAEYASGSGVEDTAALDYAGSWRARLEAVQGVINAGWFGIGGQPATLADLIASLRIGSESEKNTLDTALQLLNGADDATDIFNTVRGLLGDAVETTMEGGMLAVLIASSISNAAIAGIMAGQIDRLIAALDGGGLVAADPPPASSALGKLDAIKVQLQ